MILIRSIVFNVLFYLHLVVLFILGLPCLLGDRHASQNMARRWARGSAWLLEKVCRTRVEFRGLEHIPDGPCIIAPKHQSMLETFMVTLKVRDFTFVLKRELILIPFFGWYLRGAEMIAIDRRKRSSALTQVARAARKILNDGRQIFIFPEGTRRPVGAPPDYKAGVALIYAETGATCVPVALNSGLFWPRRSFLRRPGTVVIEFLEPIPPGLGKNTFMSLLQSRIETATNRLVEEALRTDPSLRASLPVSSGAATASS